jgi:hypothetical protein
MLSAEHRRPLAAFFLVLAVAAFIMTNGMRTQIVRQLISAGAPPSVIGALAPDMVLGQSLRHVAVRPEPTPQAITKIVDQPVAGSGPSSSTASSQAARSLPSIATVVQSVSPESAPAGKSRRGSSHGPVKTPVRAGTSPVTTSPVTTPTSPTTPATGDPSSPTTPPKVTDELDGQGKHHLTEAELLARQAAKEARHEANRVARRAAKETERVRQEEHRARVAERQAEREQRRAEHRGGHRGDKVEKTVQITVKGLQGGVTHRDNSRGHDTRSTKTSHSSASVRHDQAKQDRAAEQHQAKQDRAAKQHQAQQAKSAKQDRAAQQHQAKQDRAAKQDKAKRDESRQDKSKQDQAATRDERRDQQHGSRGHRG